MLPFGGSRQSGSAPIPIVSERHIYEEVVPWTVPPWSRRAQSVALAARLIAFSFSGVEPPFSTTTEYRLWKAGFGRNRIPSILLTIVVYPSTRVSGRVRELAALVEDAAVLNSDHSAIRSLVDDLKRDLEQAERELLRIDIRLRRELRRKQRAEAVGTPVLALFGNALSYTAIEFDAGADRQKQTLPGSTDNVARRS